MGAGRCDSRHWDPDRKLTDSERAIFWENKSMQYKGEVMIANTKLRQADATLERLAFRIKDLEREVAEYHRCFGTMGFEP